MVYVEGGSFMMGCKDGEADEAPVHQVTVDAFYISKHEVTVGQYQQFCEATAWQMPEAPAWGWNDQDPMVRVSWRDAGAYALWLSRMTGKKYRLPQEAEWEYAARGGKNDQSIIYSGSNEAEEVAWFFETTYGSAPQPVGLKKPNILGIYDMSGNVWEWCKNRYNFYEDEKKDAGDYRVLRGGGWDDPPQHTRVFNRDKNVPDAKTDQIGFRLAKDE